MHLVRPVAMSNIDINRMKLLLSNHLKDNLGKAIKAIQAVFTILPQLRLRHQHLIMLLINFRMDTGLHQT